jgi:hypothetical protein
MDLLKAATDGRIEEAEDAMQFKIDEIRNECESKIENLTNK